MTTTLAAINIHSLLSDKNMKRLQSIQTESWGRAITIVSAIIPACSSLNRLNNIKNITKASLQGHDLQNNNMLNFL